MIEFPEPTLPEIRSANAAPAPVIPCPCCGTAMTRGTGRMEHTFFGFLMTGWSYLVLAFRTDGRKRKIVMVPGRSGDAHLCDRCGTFLLESPLSWPVPCAACGSTIPSGISACKECGSYCRPLDKPVDY